MANKCLRRSLRSGLLGFFMNMHRPSASAADRKLRTNQLHNMLSIDAADHPADHAASMASSSSCCSSSSMRGALAHQYSAASFPPLHLAATRPCFPLVSSTSSSACFNAADPADLPAVGSYGDLQHIDDHDHTNLLSHDGDHKLQGRSHSCSKLHRRLMVPPFKSLLHHSHSHGRHSQICSSRSSRIILNIDHADEEPGINVSSRTAASSPSCVGEYTRSWSSPSLRHMKKAAGISSFHGALQAAGSSSKGKRAPKGHVAVYVEGGKERHVVPIRYLSHPHFQELLERAESEFGFAQKGGLLLPCSRSELQHTLSRISP